MRTFLRTAQTRAPWLSEAKASAQRTMRRVTRRPFEPDFRAIPLLGLGAGARYLDIGANRGQSIDAIKLLGNQPIVHAFEPNSGLAARLERRFRRDADVTIHALALADEPGTFTLHIPVYRNYVFDGLASLDETAARQWLDGRILGFDERHLRVQRVTCEVVRLDDLDLAPDFIKLDVQGGEYRAVLGAVGTIERHRPVILVESAGDELDELLADHGYRRHGFLDGRLEPDAEGPVNSFYLPG